MKNKENYLAYKSYKNMMRNCYYGREQTYYQDNNVQVCLRWLNNFEQFLEDMGDKPTEKHKLCRINTNLDYSPDNCVWCLTPERKDAIVITYNKETKSLKDWCLCLGVNYWTVYYRIQRNKFRQTPEEIIGKLSRGK